MPWTCTDCRAEVPDDTTKCPGCSGTKSTWSLQLDKTRNFVISRARFLLLRGEVTAPTPATDPLYDPYALVKPPVARVLTKRAALDLFKGKQQPASYDLLVVRLFPKDDVGDVKLVVDFAVREIFEQSFPVPEAPFVDVPFLFVAGSEDLPPDFGFPGLHVVDITEETERGFSPEVEFTAMNRKPIELPTEPAGPVDPDKIDSAVLPGGVFALESSFPTPAIAPFLDRLANLVEESPTARLGLFGHADVSGSEAYNKDLTDRRAMAVYALLRGDVETLEWIAESEEWGLDVYQAMLRTLTCNPGALDGEGGPLTEAAVTLFQELSTEGRLGPDVPALSVDGELGPETRGALLRAYVGELSLALPEDAFYGPVTSGCSEFNPLGGPPEEDRRVAVAVYGETPPDPAEFPCVAGDASACTLDGAGVQRCSFYRERVRERPLEVDPRPFFDFQWLPLPSHKVNLSAVTSLPDGTEVTFQVYRCTNGLPADLPLAGLGEPDLAFGEPWSIQLSGVVRHGVALCLWGPPPDAHPFEVSGWFVDPGADVSLQERYEQSPGFQPPVFVVRSGEQWGISRPPGQRLDRLHLLEAEGATGNVLSSSGQLLRFEVDQERVQVPGRKRTDPHLEVVALLGQTTWHPHTTEESNG